MSRAKRSGRGSERGFTLIEVMLVVAVVAILATLAVPSFFKTSRKGKAESEINALFAEIGAKQEQYKSDFNVYFPLTSASTAATTSTCPTTSTTTGTAGTECTDTGKPFFPLRMAQTLQTLRCSYAITAGTAAMSASNPDGFTFTSPAMNWYYVIATCDTDGVTSVNSKYFMSSVDTAIQSQNVGK